MPHNHRSSYPSYVAITHPYSSHSQNCNPSSPQQQQHLNSPPRPLGESESLHCDFSHPFPKRTLTPPTSPLACSIKSLAAPHPINCPLVPASRLKDTCYPPLSCVTGASGDRSPLSSLPRFVLSCKYRYPFLLPFLILVIIAGFALCLVTATSSYDSHFLCKNNQPRTLQEVLLSTPAPDMSPRGYAASEMRKKVLLTGGTGYIGSHTCLEILSEGWEVIVVDNFGNSNRESIRRIEELTGQSITVERLDLRDPEAVDAFFAKYHDQIDTVVHFAGLKAVGESVEEPLLYYENNIGGTVNLLRVMEKYNCRNIVFSSSATVYGQPEFLPITEDHPLHPTNPYGRTKYMIEQIMMDVANSKKGKRPAGGGHLDQWNIVLLRYFNPVGAHSSGRIGEDPRGVPNNLMPFVAQVAVGMRPHVNVFGNAYDTPDGTGVRDYIHVVDLAKGHVAAIRHAREDNCGLVQYNLGTGVGYSVLEMIRAMERASGVTIPYKVVSQRAGDVAMMYADATKAEIGLRWKATQGLDKMCEDLWRWQSNNPNGYETAD